MTTPLSPALRYHKGTRPGKLAIQPTKPLATQQDLSLAYTPGVAEPVLAIAEDPSKAFDYTAKGNLVAIVTNGSAILGLGNRGALAAKPVMEGKSVLFKKFADIDAFDLEINASDPKLIIEIIAALEPTFGGINLEDIKAPECFIIERELQKRMKIPVFHDDQHGTAIVCSAGILNALDLAGKNIASAKMTISGAGAAGIAIANMLLSLGVKPAHLLMIDSVGVVHSERTDLNEYKQAFAVKTGARTLADALNGCDVFIGVSKADTVTVDMLRSMAKTPVVFAMANPDPEIDYALAMSARDDLIMATGRSDYPNQVNNVLCFPFLFRGALDARAAAITQQMKIAAVHALADLAKQPVPEEVLKIYKLKSLIFGKDYIIPKPFDPRLKEWVAGAVKRAATL